MIEITQEMLDKIYTDSDVYELAEELGVSNRELFYVIENKYAEGTPCHNCKYVDGYTNRCSFCSRKYTVTDNYESI